MKLKIKGESVLGFLEFNLCEVTLALGRIQTIISLRENVYYTISYNSEFKLEKIFYEKYYKSLKHTYQILYHDSVGETKQILIKPTFFERLKIKWIFKQYLIQSKEMKVNLLKYFIGAIFGFLSSLIFKYYFEK